MTISVGDALPEATLLRIGNEGPEAVDLSTLTMGRKVAMFGVPGAFTATCTAAHVPSFIRTKPGFDAKGVDEIICLSVNDPFVMHAWAETTGATEAGLAMLADADASLTKAMGLEFSVPAAGFIDRSKRYALYAEDGIVKVLNIEPERGCTISAGEALLEAI